MKLLGIALLGLAASSTSAFATPPAADYVKMAGASDLFEIKSSKLVEGSTTNPQIKSFADEMIADHTKSTQDVKAAAMRAGLTPGTPMLTAKQRSDYAALMHAKGAARNSLYLQQQQAAHQDALLLQQDYANSGDKPTLQAAASNIVPVVQHHIQMLGQIGG